MNLADPIPGRAPSSAPKASATVLVAHGCPIVSAGLVSTLRRFADWDIRIWDQARGPWQQVSPHDSVDVVVADAEGLAPPDSSPNRRAADSPRLVLIAAQLGREMPPGVDACLSIRCGEEELFDAVNALIDHRPPHLPAVRSRPTGGLPPGALRRVRQHIEERLAEKIELGALAAIAGLSECHFSRAFKQSLGLPPHRYLMRRRIAAAAELIKGTAQSLTEISLGVGFSDQSHFTRMFVRMMGETPRAFRHRHR